VYWTANARDGALRLTQGTAGSGVVTTQAFDPLTDRLTSILAGTSGAVENFSYTYDVLGNVLTRTDANESLTETLTYDNRVTQATVTANIAPVKTFSYDPVGNLLSKSDIGYTDGVTQNGPLGIVYFDVLDRDTQGFDASTIQVSKQYGLTSRTSFP
jgi:YD repeat-containing protein